MHPCGCKSNNKIPVKKFTVFLNGNHHKYVQIVINPKKIRKWHHVLGEVTEKLDPYFGMVNKLYTSDSGVSVNSFTDIKNNGSYVASANRKFQFVPGGYITAEARKKNEYFEHYLDAQLTRLNRRKKLTYCRRDLNVIYVFSNGKENYPPAKLVLTRDDLEHWDRVLNHIALVLDTPELDIKALYDAQGNRLCGPWELQHGASYVAVGFHERFIPRNYKIKENITETWKCCKQPIVARHKNTPCHHKNVEQPSWKKNFEWKTNVDAPDQIESFEGINKDVFYYDVESDEPQAPCKCPRNGKKAVPEKENTRKNYVKNWLSQCIGRKNPSPKPSDTQTSCKCALQPAGHLTFTPCN